MQLHTNQRLLVNELIARGASINLLDANEELLIIKYKDREEFLLDRFSSKAPYHVVKISADKYLAKRMMSNKGISVPEGGIFSGKSVEDALQYAQDRYPLVLKPNWGSHGNHVQVDIRNSDSLELAIWHFLAHMGPNEPFILEKFYPWSEHRVFVTNVGGFAVVMRDPASVIGNGISTIETLAANESERRIELKKQQPTSLCPIAIDKEVMRCLKMQNYTLQTVPSKGEKVYLRQQSNLAKGGMSIDMTDIVDATVQEIGVRALSAFPGLPCVGLDLLCADITQPLTSSDYVIIEANSNPGLAMHTYPSIGQSRNVAALVADAMFPEFFK